MLFGCEGNRRETLASHSFLVSCRNFPRAPTFSVPISSMMQKFTTWQRHSRRDPGKAPGLHEAPAPLLNNTWLEIQRGSYSFQECVKVVARWRVYICYLELNRTNVPDMVVFQKQ